MIQQVAIVTGANRGIGRAIALELARRGYRTVINWLDDPQRNDSLAAELDAIGAPYLFQQGDVSLETDVDSLMDQTIRQFGQIDVLVNNAAIQRDAAAIDINIADFDRTLAVNLRGPFLCAQRAARRMIERKQGRIINISSIHQFVPKRSFLPYALSKAALGMLTKNLALEFGPAGIAVVGLAPGGVQSTMADRSPDVLINSTPIRGIATPEDVAEAVLYLASNSARFVNGSTLVMDGGLMLGPYTRSDF
jgi:glucose 1-dehydrogenase